MLVFILKLWGLNTRMSKIGSQNIAFLTLKLPLFSIYTPHIKASGINILMQYTDTPTTHQFQIKSKN